MQFNYSWLKYLCRTNLLLVSLQLNANFGHTTNRSAFVDKLITSIRSCGYFMRPKSGQITLQFNIPYKTELFVLFVATVINACLFICKNNRKETARIYDFALAQNSCSKSGISISFGQTFSNKRCGKFQVVFVLKKWNINQLEIVYQNLIFVSKSEISYLN